MSWTSPTEKKTIKDIFVPIFFNRLNLKPPRPLPRKVKFFYILAAFLFYKNWYCSLQFSQK